ncbi:MAG: phosphoenolpyruvate synthase/pyruvate phosphate dikinase [Deltaproteobacteria bacterium]|nr:phosphoenolpyruvate synthase/pyruvate phosphate dikinase [Deltaproteobacteria bacterium]
MAGKQFVDPHDVPVIAGTEGWERMYPYQYQFSQEDSERKTFESSQLWYYDGLHYPEPHYPFDLIWDEAWSLALSQYNTRHFIIPPALGVDHRIVNGYVYISPVGIADQDVVAKRVPFFIERAGYYYQNWDKLYENWKKKVTALIGELESMNFKELPEMEDISVIKDGLGRGSGFQLLKDYDDLINMGLLNWQYHFEFLNLGYAAYVTFINTANQIFPDIPMSTLTKMISGIDVVMYKPDAELIRLAKLAIDTNLAELFKKPWNAAELMAELGKAPAGKDWLAEFDSIRMHIKSLQEGKQVGRPTGKLVEERNRIVTEYKKLIRTDDDKEAFEQALAVARTVFPYVEDHLFYIEHWFHSIFWGKVRQIGTILSDQGFIEDAEDIWFLKRDEIKQALWDYCTAWATGVKPRGPSYWPKEVSWRKDVLEKFRNWKPLPALGVPPDVVTEPFTIVLWGVTTDVLGEWLKGGGEGEGQQNEFKGSPGSSGVVEGRARVLKNVTELADLREGEILVATTTSPSWAPAFVKIAGAVTDVGGPMCHAAIVCREYGLPTVVGTGKATTLIKTGDLIRIDGDSGLVTILERA